MMASKYCSCWKRHPVIPVDLEHEGDLDEKPRLGTGKFQPQTPLVGECTVDVTVQIRQTDTGQQDILWDCIEQNS